jgi:hypothetical protein
MFRQDIFRDGFAGFLRFFLVGPVLVNLGRLVRVCGCRRGRGGLAWGDLNVGSAFGNAALDDCPTFRPFGLASIELIGAYLAKVNGWVGLCLPSGFLPFLLLFGC